MKSFKDVSGRDREFYRRLFIESGFPFYFTGSSSMKSSRQDFKDSSLRILKDSSLSHSGKIGL